MLSVRNLVKSYPGRGGGSASTAVDGISFEVGQGDVFTLLGPSGCGKTTTLQCIAGLETPTSGTIEIGGRTVFCSERRIMVPANRRALGMVFQSYAIWPHMSVFANVAFPLVHGAVRRPAAEVRGRVMRALEMVKLQHLAERPAPHLSGGQQQRVAVARALVHEPRLLLLDEPLSNLDAKLRDTMRIEIRQLAKSLGITTIFVTHDQLEAMSMSDAIVLLRDGRIVQQGAPRDVFLRPAAAFAADFMGRSNLIPGRLSAAGDAVATVFGEVACAVSAGLAPGSAVVLVARPNVLAVSRGASSEALAPNTFDARIAGQSFLGDAVEADIVIGTQALRAAIDPYQALADGEPVRVTFPPERCVAVPAETPAAASAAA